MSQNETQPQPLAWGPEQAVSGSTTSPNLISLAVFNNVLYYFYSNSIIYGFSTDGLQWNTVQSTLGNVVPSSFATAVLNNGNLTIVYTNNYAKQLFSISTSDSSPWSPGTSTPTSNSVASNADNPALLLFEDSLYCAYLQVINNSPTG
jgi:hypothetical protein